MRSHIIMDQKLTSISEKPSSRADNSLYVLTIKFLEIVNKSETKCIDLKYACKILNVHKRRIYDITNILEGMNVVKKETVNTIKWIGEDPSLIIEEFHYLNEDKYRKSEETEIFSDNENNDPNVILKKDYTKSKINPTPINRDEEEIEMQRLLKEEKEIDEEICRINNELNFISTEPSMKDFLYVNYKDIITLKSLKNKTTFAVKAPQDSYFEMNKENSEHILQINSNEDKIDVYYIGEDK